MFIILYFNSMGYIVAFLTISSILIDVCFTNLIFIGAIFNSYNYWYLLPYSNQFTLHYSILFLIISIIIIPLIYCYFIYYMRFLFLNIISIIPNQFLMFSCYYRRKALYITYFLVLLPNNWTYNEYYIWY